MKNLLKILPLLVIIFSITSCSTPYQKIGYSGGYSERKISSDKDGQSFIVSFNGNGYTNHQKVEDFAFLRSAEIAIENDFKYFVVISKGQFFEDVTKYREPARSPKFSTTSPFLN